jgi:type I restriction enzyme S subunit
MYYGLSVSGVETPTQYKLITTTSINKETFKLDEGKIPFCNLITNEDKQTKKFTKYFVKKGDILISRSGTTGVAILIDKDYNNMLFGSYLIKIKLNSLIDPKFFWYFSQSPFYWQQVSSRGATIKNINLQILKNLQVPLPTLEEQRKISEILLAVDEKLENLRREKTKLERIKQWFMEELLTGRIRVRVA